MYDVNITNNFWYLITVVEDGDKESTVDPGGGTAQYTNWGTVRISVPGMGDIFFKDLGDTKLPEYTDPKIAWTEYTWGGIVRYQGVDAYFRYEGQGKIKMTLDDLGTLDLEFDKGGGMLTGIPEIKTTIS